MLNRELRVVVVGSSNVDMVVRSPRMPQPGETILGGVFAMVPGGKGANQAVAAARLGGSVTFVARVGDDLFGQNSVDGFERDGIDIRYVTRDSEEPSGVALITIDAARGENSIVVAPGANARLTPDDIAHASDVITRADVVICQLETPLETVEAALKLAHTSGVRTILNPAPAQPLPESLLAHVSILTPNETEAVLLAGNPSLTPIEAARALMQLGVEAIVLTLGSNGAQIFTADGETHVAGFSVPSVVDTTAAGDCFNGALGVALAEGKSFAEAARFGNAAAALSVTKAGAQPSLPTRRDVDDFLQGIMPGE